MRKNEFTESWSRKVNKNETFAPTEKSKAIIAAAMTEMPKAKFYNLLIERFGAVVVSEYCIYGVVKELVEKYPDLEKPKEIID